MAPGPAPAETRRRRNVPARGEWIDLPALDEPILPDLPRRAKGAGAWSARTKAMWSGWRQDRATTQYGPGTIALAIQLAYLFEDYVRGNEKFSEVRLVMDGLGLTEKGKRDLRWRVPSDEEPATPQRQRSSSKSSGRRARLSVVPDPE